MQKEEEDLISQFATQMYSEYVGAEITGYIPVGGEESCSVGTEITGSETSQTLNRESLKWRIWDFDGNTIRIIGDSTGSLNLKGAAGYNNGVWALDYICKELYSNNKPGVTVTNLKRTDIQKVSTYDYTNYKHNLNGWQENTSNDDTSSDLIHFGETKTYNDAYQYPDMWDKNDKDWTYTYKGGTVTGRDKECKIWEVIETGKGQMKNDMNKGDTNTTFKQSYYAHDYKKNEFINDLYYDLIFKNSNGEDAGEYWLAGRCVHLKQSICSFSIQFLLAKEGGHSVNGRVMCKSDGTDETENYYHMLRPIVSIDLNKSKCNLLMKTDSEGNREYELRWNEE